MTDARHAMTLVARDVSVAYGARVALKPTSVELARGELVALVVAVLHDLSLAARFCTRVLLLDEGVVVDDDRPERVLNARALERHYRVEPIVMTHEGEPLILPWRRLER